MWILTTNESDKNKILYLTPKKPTISVGRAGGGCDVGLEGDSSISRKHCTLHYAEKKDCPGPVQTKSGIWIEDCGSKYGTYIKIADKLVKIEVGAKTLLEHGSVIRIGVLQHTFTVEYKPIYVSASKMSSERRLELRKQLQAIGGDFTNVCDFRTSYLIVDAITFTAKVLLALIYGIPIVTDSFVSVLLEAVLSNRPLPETRPYRPRLAELTVRAADVNLEPGLKRNTLFKGLKFYSIYADQVKNFQPVIEAAGGKISLLKGNEREILLSNGAIVIEASQICTPSQSSDDSFSVMSQIMTDIRDFLSRHGRKVVPDREIPNAIAYASVSRMCSAVCDNFSVDLHSRSKPFSQYTLLQELSEPQDPVVAGVFSRRVVESSQSQDSHYTGSGHLMEPETAVAPGKRPASCDLFDEPPSKKASTLSVAVSRLQLNRIAESPEKDLSQSRTLSNVEKNHQRIENTVATDLDNPFGKRKPISVENSAKRQKTMDLDEPSLVPSCLENTAPVEASIEEATKPREQPLAPTLTLQTLPRGKQIAADSQGWYDMTDRKPKLDKMGAKVIILPLLNTSEMIQQNTETVNSTPTRLENVKRFRKQKVPAFDAIIGFDDVTGIIPEASM